LIVAERHRLKILDRRVLLRPSNALLFAFERRAATIAVDVDFKGPGVVNKVIDSGELHGWIRKDLAPGTERLIGRDECGPMLVTGTDQPERSEVSA
jgi:hypothetical protein